MPYPNDHGRLTWGGGAWSNNEIWQCGLRLSSAEAPSSSQVDAWVAGVTAYMTTVQNTHVLEWLKWAPIGTDGKYLDAPDIIERDMHIVGSNGKSFRFPGQVSAVVTMRSAKKRGSATHGRFYPPTQPVFVDTDGRIQAGDKDALATAAKTLVNAINSAAADGKHEVSLCSPGGKKTTPDQQKVVSVGVGRVLDTQRRRRSALPEERADVPL